jgi:hypothetical protein
LSAVTSDATVLQSFDGHDAAFGINRWQFPHWWRLNTGSGTGNLQTQTFGTVGSSGSMRGTRQRLT